MQEIKLFDTRKPYYKYSRIKTSAAVCTILLSLAAYNCQKGDYALPTLKRRESYYSYSWLNTSRMSLVPFEAFVDPRGRPGPLLRFPGGPASGLVVRREPTWVHWLSPSSSTVSAGGGPGFGV
jgi:hypothetical protein